MRTLIKHYALRAVWTVLPPVARRTVTAIRLARRRPRIVN